MAKINLDEKGRIVSYQFSELGHEALGALKRARRAGCRHDPLVGTDFPIATRNVP